jgi:hypothetical protein
MTSAAALDASLRCSDARPNSRREPCGCPPPSTYRQRRFCCHLRFCARRSTADARAANPAPPDPRDCARQPRAPSTPKAQAARGNDERAGADRTPASGRKHERRTTRRGRDPDARFSAKRSSAKDAAGRGVGRSVGGAGFDACFHAEACVRGLDAGAPVRGKALARYRPAEPRERSSRWPTSAVALARTSRLAAERRWPVERQPGCTASRALPTVDHFSESACDCS